MHFPIPDCVHDAHLPLMPSGVWKNLTKDHLWFSPRSCQWLCNFFCGASGSFGRVRGLTCDASVHRIWPMAGWGLVAIYFIDKRVKATTEELDNSIEINT